jgi:beta-glucanase (GH16 family)
MVKYVTKKVSIAPRSNVFNVIFIRPAIWMLPKYSAYGGWPASGEIDIVIMHIHVRTLSLTDLRFFFFL